MTGAELLAKFIDGSTSQAAVARESSCSESHLSLYLKGKKRLSVDMAKKIAAVTGIPAAKLLDLEPAE